VLSRRTETAHRNLARQTGEKREEQNREGITWNSNTYTKRWADSITEVDEMAGAQFLVKPPFQQMMREHYAGEPLQRLCILKGWN